MIDNLSNHEESDFLRRYQDTYGWMIKGDTKTLIQVRNIDEGMLTLRDANLEYINIPVDDDGPDFEFLSVEKKLFAYRNSIYLASRVPARQWRRGVCESNTRIQLVGGRAQLDVDHATVTAMFAPATYPKQVPCGWLLSHQMAIVESRIYLYDIQIGLVRQQTAAVVPMFRDHFAKVVPSYFFKEIV